MVDSDMIQFCLANVSRNDRMASRVHDLGLKARYAESANHWRRLAEQMRNEAYPTDSGVWPYVINATMSVMNKVPGASYSR
jgi:hypothetical protein